LIPPTGLAVSPFSAESHGLRNLLWLAAVATGPGRYSKMHELGARVLMGAVQKK
jgi:hypothetical protein